MSLRETRQHVGQFAMVGFDGPSIPVELRALVREFNVGGIVLFKRNVEDPAQVAELAFELRHLSETPLWVAVDQEGGRVARLRRPFTEWPPMATLGRAGDRALVQRFAAAMARELKAVGISLDFAPVLDVATNPRNPVIGDRALSDDAEKVSEYGRIIIEALQSQGIAACGKHFPGHGDTAADSHHDLPIIEHPPERFEAVEFVPFRSAIAAGVASIMVGHLLVPAFDEEHPASQSPRTIGRYLREHLAFDGLVCTDDMDMKAISGRQPLEQASVRAIGAGCDVVLLCGADHDLHARVLESIIRASEREELRFSQLDGSRVRQRRMKERFLSSPAGRPLPAAELSRLIGTTEHVAVADAMAPYA
jgi:beta-N-acetylhexosaminidase